MDCDELTNDMKKKNLQLLIFMVAKRDGMIKSRGVAHGGYQRVYTDKYDVSSPTPDFYSLKHVYAVAIKE